MPHEVIMPALGMAQDTGVIVSWHKARGDAVAADETLFEVETDKATMEVPAGADGVLTQIRADAGAEVPVGEVIALIGESAEDVADGPAPAAVPERSDLPSGDTVIMPALGMAQDTGLIVAWHRAPGDKVVASDILFEVETDKSTMEVEAGFDGYVAALLAEAGEEAPVGETIAVITADKPDTPVQQSRAGRSESGAMTVARPEERPVPAREKPSRKPAAVPPDGRILASPKARRLALEQGLDLKRLVEIGHPQPYHVADLDLLKSLPAKAPGGAEPSARRLTAEIPAYGFPAFADWAAESAGLADANALLAGMAGASLGRDGGVVVVESYGPARAYAVPLGPLAGITPAEPDTAPDLRLRDLRQGRIATVDLGAEDAPVLTLTQRGDALSITLECASHQLSASEAVALLSEFAGRMEQPLRHLL